MRIESYTLIILLFVVFILSALTSGCWDRHEIENRGYVLGVAIDYADPSPPEKKPDLLYAAQTSGNRKYHVTYELPRFSKKEGNGESAGKDQQHIILEGEGESLFEVARSIASKIYFPLYFEDMQLIVVSEAVAQDGIGGLLDFFFRDSEMRRRAKVAIAVGRADDILKSKVSTEEVTSSFVYKISKNSDKTPTFAIVDDLGTISKAIAQNRGFILPMITTNGKEVKLKNGAMFNREQRFISPLTELEVIGSKMLKKTLKQGVISVANPLEKNKLVVFELFQSDIKVDSHLQGDQLSFSVQAKLTGNLGERLDGPGDILNNDFITAVEEAVAQEYTRLVFAAYHKQQLYKVDGNALGELVHRQHPEYWNQIQNRWEADVFPTIPLDVDIKVSIVRSAMVR